MGVEHMSEVLFEASYYDTIRQKVMDLANVLQVQFPWVLFEDDFLNFIGEKKRRIQASNMSLDDEEAELEKLRRMQRRLIALSEALAQFIDDAAEICKPGEVSQ
jgi:hypothetical protein